MFVAVAVEKTNFCFDKLFDYEVPKNLISKIQIGVLVAVPFGKNDCLRQAVVLKIHNSFKLNCKQIFSVLSDKSLISNNLLQIVKFLHFNYFCSWFEALKTVLPSGVFFKPIPIWNFKIVHDVKLNSLEQKIILNLQKLSEQNLTSELNKQIMNLIKNKNNKTICSLIKKGFIFKSCLFKSKVGFKKNEQVIANDLLNSKLKLTHKQQVLLNFIKKNGPISSKEACYKSGIGVFVFNKLKKLNLLKFVDVKNNLVLHDKINNKRIDDIVLNVEQKKVADGLITLIKTQTFKTALIKGVTGSGKTIVFLKLIDFVLKLQKQVILLVPEISLTPQIVKFFKMFFGNLISVLNSSLTITQQLNEHKKIKAGAVKLIIGTRSAIFAPCNNLGLIIMDEEGELTYKNAESSPRYHARDVALFRCCQNKALLILASATPSIETQYFAKIGHYYEFILKNRFQNIPLPLVKIVNFSNLNKSPIEGISIDLFNEIKKNLKNKEQTIILLNRRGHNSGVVCLNCGFKLECPNCSAVLTYHSANKSLICHYCGHIQPKIKVCKKCLESNLIYFGEGTQKIEHDLINFFSNAKILRLDSDSVYGKFDLEKKINSFEKGEFDLLIGTQMVAKGLNFANVTLVGVVSIDNMLYGSDFKNNEQMFSLLTQVVGRSGRSTKLGRAIIQTQNPNNSVILKAAAQNYDAFYNEEIVERKTFLLPPFCDICVVNFSGTNVSKLIVCAKSFIAECKIQANYEVPIKILGISTPFIEKINKRHRKRVIIKCKNNRNFRLWLKKIVEKVFLLKCFNGVRSNIDINGEIL